ASCRDARSGVFRAFGRERGGAKMRRQVAVICLEGVERPHKLDRSDSSIEEFAKRGRQRRAAEDLGRYGILPKNRAFDALAKRRAAPARVLVLVCAHALSRRGQRSGAKRLRVGTHAAATQALERDDRLCRSNREAGPLIRNRSEQRRLV